MTQESPPGFGIYFPGPGHEVFQWAYDEAVWPDAAIFKQLPDRLKLELQEYYDRARQDVLDGVHPLTAWRSGQPCFWLDTTTRRCKNYEHRPATCREFEPGEDACLAYRREGGLQC